MSHIDFALSPHEIKVCVLCCKLPAQVSYSGSIWPSGVRLPPGLSRLSPARQSGSSLGDAVMTLA